MNVKDITRVVQHRIGQVFGLYMIIFLPMWIMYILNNTVLFNLWNAFGIIPRSLSLNSMVGVIASWTMHGNFAHIIGNTIILAQILFLFGLFERNAYRTIIKLIIGSGLMTWGLGSPFSIHIGASGLVFAMLGYMIGGAIFAKRWGYLLACLLMGASYWLVLKQGLMPQTGISFAAHFGGLCVGLLIGANSKHYYVN